MKKILLIIATFFCTQIYLFAGIGTTNIAVIDANRANRNIPCDVYYPATSNGANVPIATGNFGVVVVGHGFVMGTDAYKYLGDSLSNAGYIVFVVNTETGFTKSIETFALDLAKVADECIALNSTATSIFFNHINGKIIVLGHSMGGLATLKSTNLSTNIKAAIVLSPADSGSIATAICSNITKPSFTITGSKDCVAPPATNAKLIYDALKSDCKFYMNITDATHCGLADANTICSIGEGACLGASTVISRNQQHRLILQPLYLYLDYYANGNAISFTNFNNYINAADSFTFEKKCNPLSFDDLDLKSFYVTTNQIGNFLQIASPILLQKIVMQNVYGQNMNVSFICQSNQTVDISHLSAGLYFITIINKQGNKVTNKIILQ